MLSHGNHSKHISAIIPRPFFLTGYALSALRNIMGNLYIVSKPGRLKRDQRKNPDPKYRSYLNRRATARKARNFSMDIEEERLNVLLYKPSGL